MKFFIYLIVPMFFLVLSCASKSKIDHLHKPNVATKFLDADKDTLLIKPTLSNSHNDKLIFYFHGSAGPDKYSLDDAFLFAEYGFNVVALCWYNCNKKYSDDLDAFEKIDLQKISKKIGLAQSAISWNNTNIYFVGMSRGAEAVALLISHPELTTKIPAKAVLISGISVTAESRKSIPRTVLSERLSKISNDNTYSSEKNSWSMGPIDILNRTTIEVNKYNFPLMIIHGDNDRLWSVQNAYQLQQNYEKNGQKAELTIIKDGMHRFPIQSSEAFEKMINFLSR